VQIFELKFQTPTTGNFAPFCIARNVGLSPETGFPPFSQAPLRENQILPDDASKATPIVTKAPLIAGSITLIFVVPSLENPMPQAQLCPPTPGMSVGLKD